MKNKNRLPWRYACALAGVLTASPSFAQTPTVATAVPKAKAKTSAPPKARLSSLPRAKPKSTIKMDFRDAPIDQILNFFSVTSGLTVVKDSGLQGTATLISPRPLTMDQAFNILSELLDSRGYRMERTPLLIRVTPKGGGGGRGNGFAGAGGGAGGGGFGGAGFGGGGRGNLQTQVFRLQYASARGVTTIVNDLFNGGNGSGGNRGGNNRGGGGGGQIPGVFPGGGFPGGGFPGGGFPGGGGNNFNNGGANANNSAQNTTNSATGGARASADDYSNSVVVYGSSSQLEQVSAIIEQIDQPIGSTQVTQVFPLRYLSATEMSTVISNVLLASTNSGSRSTGAAGNVPLEQRVAMTARGRANNATNGQVVASTETNSLIVTASDESLNLVEQVIKELDKPLPVKGTTFVRQLKSASASDVADILNQIYNTRNRQNTQYGSSANRTSLGQNNRQSTSQNRSNSSPFGNNSGGGFQRN